MRSNNNNTRPYFAVCVRNDGCEDLEVRRIYQILADESASKDGYVRVVDESGEDYLYPADFFMQIQLPQKVERALQATSEMALTPT